MKATMQTNYIIYLGLYDATCTKQIATKSDVAKCLQKYGIQGCTILDAIGVYKNNVEKSLQITIYDSSLKTINELITKLQSAYNQEEIIVEIKKSKILNYKQSIN